MDLLKIKIMKKHPKYEKMTIEMVGMVTELQFVLHQHLTAYYIVESGEQYLRLDWEDLPRMIKAIENYYDDDY